MSPLGYRRSTPSATSADSGMQRVASEGRAARGTMRALALLVDRLAMAGSGRAVQDMSPEHQARLRDALRQLTGRIREAHCSAV